MAGDDEQPSARLSWRAKVRTARSAAVLVWSSAPLLVAMLALVSLAAGLTAPATAWLQREILNALVPEGGRQLALTNGHLLVLVLELGVAGIAAAVVPQGQQYVQGNLRRAVKAITYDRLYQAVASWPGIARFESPDFADKLQLTTQLAQSSASTLVTSVIGTAQSIVSAATFLLTLIVINPVLAVVTAAVQCLAIVAGLRNADRQARLTVDNSIRSRRQQWYGSILSSAMTAKEVRLFGLGGFLRGRMLAEVAAVNDSERMLARRLLSVESALAAVSSAVIAGGMAWTVALVAAGRLPLGDVSLFVIAAVGMQGAINGIASSMGNIAQSATMFGAYTDVVSAPPDLPIAASPLPLGPLTNGISVEDVWFRYDESQPWVLRGVSLFIPAGGHIALVGLNGSGKSTLVKLLCRLYDPAQGCIRWDGIDIRELDPVALRSRITGIFQDYTCYEMTAAENIGIGDLTALDDRDAIRRAAELAGADKHIRRLPHGYDTLLSRVFLQGKRGKGARIGMMLSGGQGQRLALARALMRADRDLLIVDEPMASLDAEAEHEVNRLLVDVQHERSCVLISHRLASVREADQIFVIADGVVAEQGTHAQLMIEGGSYARLFTLQAAGYQAGAANGLATGAKAVS